MKTPADYRQITDKLYNSSLASNYVFGYAMEVCSRSSSTSNLSSKTSHSPLRTTPKIRICASVSDEDVKFARCNVTESHVIIEGKSYSKSVFDYALKPATSQEEVYTSFLADTIQHVLNGHDTTVIAMGAKSGGKDERLYGDSVARNGLVQIAITQLITILEESSANDERFQVRMSAVMVSQKDPAILDMLSPFNPDPRHRVVRIVDDPKTGVFLDNESEIRVESIDQALFYLNTAVDHRLIQDDQTHRTSHVLISFTIYSHKMNEKQQMHGGRHRLCFLDMGIGERNSTNGGITMPTLGSVLLAMLQRNKHIPVRESSVCQLIRCALGASRFTTFVFSFGHRNDDNENIAHLACKIARTRVKTFMGQSKKTLISSGDPNSSSSADNKSRRDLESGSELSAAETVIFLGPSASPKKLPSTPTRPLHRTTRTSSQDLSKPLSIETKASPTHSCHSSCIHSIPPMLKGHTPFLSASLKLYDELCSPPGTSAPSPNAFGGVCLEDRDDFGIMIATPTASSKNKFRYTIDDGKRKQIMQWMEKSEAPPILFAAYENAGGSADVRECGGILSHPLEDIIEQEEESLRTSSATATSKKDHPLRILSKQNLDKEEKKDCSEPAEENELELVMAASLSSMKSHDILAKLEAMRNTTSGVSLSVDSTTADCENISEMDLYRRASHLEEYAMQRIREIEENKSKKKKLKLGLNCCQQSMVSSGSTVVDWAQIEKQKEEENAAAEEEKRKEALRERRARLKITELELKKEKNLIDKELDERKSLATSIARQLQHFSLSPCRGSRNQRSISAHRIDPPMASLPSTPTMSLKKTFGGSVLNNRSNCSSQSSAHQSLPRQSKLSSSSRKTSTERSERKSSKNSARRGSGGSKERQSSKEDLIWRSPYSHVTSPKAYGGPGTSSSGRGSSAPGSDFDGTINSGNGFTNGRVVRSKRQSYSASSGYESAATNDYHIYAKNAIFDKKANEEKMNFARKSDEIRHRQRLLKKELEEAKIAIGQVDDARAIGNNGDQRLNGLNRTTLIDTLLQENRILEKRLIACRNHAMLVTTFI